MAPLANSKQDRFGGLESPFNTTNSDQFRPVKFDSSNLSNEQDISTYKDSITTASSGSITTNDIGNASIDLNSSAFEFQHERQKILDHAVGKLPAIIGIMSRANKKLGNQSGSEIHDIRSIWQRCSEGEARSYNDSAN